MSSIYESRLASQDVPFSPKNPNLRSSMPFSSSKVFSHSRLPSENFGILNQFSLADLIDPKQISLINSNVKVLAKTKNKKIQFTDQAKTIFDQYEKNPIAFIAIYGKNNAGKSFWCDKTYDLADVVNKPNYQDKSSQSTITFCTTPFTKGNIKIFMLDCTGFTHQDLKRDEELRLDAIMLLSSVVVLMPDPNDHSCTIMKTAYDHFAESQKRLKYNGYPAQKRSSYWPHSLYTLYRTTQPVSKEMQKLGDLFYDYNFSIIFDAKSQNLIDKEIDLSRESFLNKSVINQHYMRHVSWVFKDIYEKIQAKKLGKLRLNGAVTRQIIFGMNRELNAGEKVDTQKIIKYATKSLYQKTFESQTDFYSRTLQSNFEGTTEKSLTLNDLFGRLKSARQKTLQSYDAQSKMYDPSSQEAEECQKKLLEFIREKQQYFEKKNKVNTQRYLEKEIPHIGAYSITRPEDFQPFVRDLKTTKQEYQHGRSEIVGERLKQACQKTSDKIFGTSEDQLKVSRLNQEINQKRKKLDQVQNENLLKNNDDRKVDEELKILRTKNDQLGADLDSWIKRRNLEENLGKEGDKLQLVDLKKRELLEQKNKLTSRLKDSEKEYETHSRWMNEKDRNVLGQTIVSELMKKVEDKRIANSRVQTTVVEMSKSMIGAEKRKLDESGIRKYRHVRR